MLRRRRRPRIILGLGTRNRNSFVSLKAHRFMTRNKSRTVDLWVLVPSRQRDTRSVSPLSLQTRDKCFFKDIHQSTINPILNLLPQVQIIEICILQKLRLTTCVAVCIFIPLRHVNVYITICFMPVSIACFHFDVILSFFLQQILYVTRDCDDWWSSKPPF